MRHSDETTLKFEAEDNDSELTADELVAAMKAGKSVYVLGATVTGPVVLSYQTIHGEISLKNCAFADYLDGSNATFNRKVAMGGSQFNGPVEFEGTTFCRFTSFDESRFKDGANFTLAQFSQGVTFRKADFSLGKPPDGEETEDFQRNALSLTIAKAHCVARFDHARVNGSIDATFFQVVGSLWCNQLYCQGPTINFEALSVSADAHFEECVFEGHFNLSRAAVSGMLRMDRAKLIATSELRSTTKLNRDGNTFFGCAIGGDAFFLGMEVADETAFTAATFQGAAFFGLAYEGLVMEYGDGAHFGAKVEFLGTRFVGTLYFAGVEANGPINFDGSTFSKNATLAARFNCLDAPVSFGGANIQGDLNLDSLFQGGLSCFRTQLAGRLFISGDCAFHRIADFREASIGSIHIISGIRDHAPDPFVGIVDLRRCRYERIVHEQGVESFWLGLREKLRQQTRDTTTDYEYDAQPYRQLEKVCREQGLDSVADSVYFESRGVSSSLERRWVNSTWDGIERYLFGYGVKPQRMIAWFLFIWLLGTLVFLIPGALSESKNVNSPAKVRVFDATIVSLQNLIPGARELVKTGTEFHNPAIVSWALLQRLSGWVFVALVARRFFAGLRAA